MFEITRVKINKLFENEPTRAIATITIDDTLLIHDVRIVEKNDKTIVKMPNRRMPSGDFKDYVHPTDQDGRAYLESVVLSEYYNYLAEKEGEKDNGHSSFNPGRIRFRQK